LTWVHGQIGKGTQLNRAWNRRKSGKVFPGRITITRIRDAADDVSHYACSVSDITKHMHLAKND